MPRDEDEPKYTVYRSRPKLFGRRDTDDERRVSDGLAELRGDAPDAPRTPPAESPRQPGQPAQPGQPGQADRPEYTVHGGGGGGPRLPRLRGRGRGRPGLPGPGPGKVVAGLTIGRVVRWVLSAALAWLLLSFVIFLVSAQVHQTSKANDALKSGGFTLTSPNTILVLGSDARTKGNAEPGATVGGPSRSDSILLIRAGGGKSARLSIPRDTVVDIPGHGRAKINAAYAIGGAALTVTTIEQYLGIDINHVVEVNFDNFPDFVDSLGGITVHTGCVQSDINGGRRNGGYSLRLRAGSNHINGRQALALARTRKNKCNPAENDLTRARRQQKILEALKHRLLSPSTFFRGPWVAWEAPQAIRSDMGGPSLLGLFGAIQIGGDPKTRVLKPSGGETLPDGGAALVVSEAEKRREVAVFLKG
jgi:LCP family protein required for cell wall assembly